MASSASKLHFGSPPVPRTRLIGRGNERKNAHALLLDEAVPLLTLTGPGGVGKTRLARTLAQDVLAHFPDGVVWVDLAPVGDTARVLFAIAQTLGLRDSGDQPAAEQLIGFLHPRTLLLVLDNVEHLLDAGPQLSELLTRCPRLTILVTSRSVLSLSGEYNLPVPPLTLPTGHGIMSATEAATSEAVRLFIERARSVRPDFTVTDANAAAVAAICQRLDGLPLAIELAAARMAHLPLLALLQRLEHRLPLLTGGARDLPGRLQTMRDAIGWSYDLLTFEEKALFRRAAIFVGGFSLEAAAATVGTGPDSITSVLDGIASLVAKSLIQAIEGPGGEPRYHMLETIREYALEQLAQSGEVDALGRRHAHYFADLAECFGPAIDGPDQRRGLAPFDVDMANLRAAIRWAIKHEECRLALRLAVALWPYWFHRGRFREGTAWTEETLALPGDAPLEDRIWALNITANMHSMGGGYARAAATAWALLDLARRERDSTGEAMAHFQLSFVARQQRDHDAAVQWAESALARFRAQGCRRWLPWAAQRAGMERLERGDFDRAERLLREAVNLFLELGDQGGTALALGDLALVLHGKGDVAGAEVLLRAMLIREAALERDWQIADILLGLADVALTRRQTPHAALLLGASETLRERVGYPGHGSQRDTQDRVASGIRSLLGDDTFDTMWQQGRAMSLSAVVTEALSNAGASHPSPPVAGEADLSAPMLTARERDVLRLLAEGHSDRLIAETLFISVKTAGKHVSHILSKLNVETRTAAATQAVRRGLV